MEKKWTNRRQMDQLFLYCWIAYTVTYLGRYNLSAAMADMVLQGVLTKSQGGLIATCFFVSYGAGQLLSGILGDKLNGRWMVGSGLLLSGAMNLAMGLTGDWRIMAAIWMVNGVTQSMIWSPLLRILAEAMPRKRCLKAGIDLATTIPAGTLASYGMTAAAIALSGWAMAFYSAGAVLIAMGLVWLAGLGALEKRAQRGMVDETEENAAPELAPAGPRPSMLAILLPSGLLITALAVMLQGALRDSITTWMPTYLTEAYGLGAQVSIIASMALPLVNLGGVYAASWMNTRVLKDELSSSAVLFALSVACLAVMVAFQQLNVALALLLLAVTTSAMHSINTMIISLLPMYFTRMRRVSTVSGMLNAVVYLGSALSAYGIGALSDYGGWGATQVAWCLMCVAGALLCLWARKVWNPYKRAHL